MYVPFGKKRNSVIRPPYHLKISILWPVSATLCITQLVSECTVLLPSLVITYKPGRRAVKYKVLTTSQPSYLNDLISVQYPRSTLSSSVVTLSRPPTISSLKITDRLLIYASPRLWNQLPDSFRQPHQSCLDSPPHSLVSSSLLSSPLSSSITPSLFHSRLKTYLFNKSFPPSYFFPRTVFTITGPDRTYHASRFIFSSCFL